ncbi:MAG: alpha-L-rhamnosidase C-terminal domain-containing protein [Bacteroides graminisolvens]
MVSKWSKTPTHLEWDVEIPANTTAVVALTQW